MVQHVQAEKWARHYLAQQVLLFHLSLQLGRCEAVLSTLNDKWEMKGQNK